MEYTIPGIPTTYRGRRYRSRLEAKWAAFFDLLGWQHEYEPFDFGDWSPDFLLSRPGSMSLLVEVKPIEQFCAETATRMIRASVSEDRSHGDLLLLGARPFLLDGSPHLGWATWIPELPAGPFHPALLYWDRTEFDAVVVADLAVNEQKYGNWFGYFTGNGGTRTTPWRKPERCQQTLQLWAQASNAVQYWPRHTPWR